MAEEPIFSVEELVEQKCKKYHEGIWNVLWSNNDQEIMVSNYEHFRIPSILVHPLH
jgi:hypothetical protein